jgi:hypothetical protein
VHFRNHTNSNSTSKNVVIYGEKPAQWQIENLFVRWNISLLQRAQTVCQTVTPHAQYFYGGADVICPIRCSGTKLLRAMN